MEAARVETMVLSAPKSLPRHKSALRAWQAFAKEVKQKKKPVLLTHKTFSILLKQVLKIEGDALPPKVDGLLLWARMFRLKFFHVQINSACHFVITGAQGRSATTCRR